MTETTICIVETIIGIVIGALVTWEVTYWYYKRAGDELRSEAADLRRLITMMLTSMERQGWAKLTRDPKGNITGYIVEQGMSGGLSFSGSLETKHISAKPTDVPSAGT